MRCYMCKKKGMSLNCSYCKNHYCMKCLQVEIHSCLKYSECIKQKKKELEKKLTDESHIGGKMTYI